MALPRILIVEDGDEYITAYQRFLGDRFAFRRAGDGDAAWSALSDGDVDAVVLDMRFDRADRLWGDAEALAERLGDPGRVRRFLEDHQGTFILAGLRDRGCRLPVVLSYDFGAEPRRFANLERRYAPLRWLGDAAGPSEIAAALRDSLGSAG